MAIKLLSSIRTKFKYISKSIFLQSKLQFIAKINSFKSIGRTFWDCNVLFYYIATHFRTSVKTSVMNFCVSAYRIGLGEDRKQMK